MVRKYTLKIVIYIIVVFKSYFYYLTHPLELVTDSLGKYFHISEEKMAFWCDRWHIHSFGVLHVSLGDLLLPIILLEYYYNLHY